MYPVLSLILIIFFGLVNTQNDPRKRIPLDSSEDFSMLANEVPISCSGALCLNKRAAPSSQEEQLVGPFWANRGKKDPNYYDGRLVVEEPHWILVRKDSESAPFFTSRGKKTRDHSRQQRRYSDDKDLADPAFFAARGKKMEQ